MEVAIPILMGGLSILQSQAQAGVLRNQAKVQEENARQAGLQSQIEQQDQDLVALAQIENELARQSGSGLEISSASALRRRNTLRVLARRDASRIRLQGDATRRNFQQEAANLRAEASSVATSGLISAFTSAGAAALGDGSGLTSLISGASQVDPTFAKNINKVG